MNLTNEQFVILLAVLCLTPIVCAAIVAGAWRHAVDRRSEIKFAQLHLDQQAFEFEKGCNDDGDEAEDWNR